ncbi:hypothetical protein [Methanoregula sp.]|jgi:hypothetical protein|uniref:hypothetical protein n=1 Tax=Methanoregula sp. TaxID=2052170 RepID=UPI003C73D6AF
MKIDEQSFEYNIYILENLFNQTTKILELRYQLAIIIIPTIIGLWGVIGVLITSSFVSLYVSRVYILIEIGFISTILLIWMWRNRVHDMVREQILTNDYRIWLELNGLGKKRFAPQFQSILELVKKKLTQMNREDFFKELKNDKKIYSFYRKFNVNLSECGCKDIDEKSKLLIYFVGVLGILLPFILIYMSNLSYNLGITGGIFIVFISWIGFEYIIRKKMNNLIVKISFNESDILDYQNYLRRNKDKTTDNILSEYHSLSKEISSRSWINKILHKIFNFCGWEDIDISKRDNLWLDYEIKTFDEIFNINEILSKLEDTPPQQRTACLWR